MVRGGGLEPPRLAAHAPQTCVATITPPARTNRMSMRLNRKAFPLLDDLAGPVNKLP